MWTFDKNTFSHNLLDLIQTRPSWLYQLKESKVSLSKLFIDMNVYFFCIGNFWTMQSSDALRYCHN